VQIVMYRKQMFVSF